MRNGILRSGAFIYHRRKTWKFSSRVCWFFIGIAICVASVPLRSQVPGNILKPPAARSAADEAASHTPTPSPTPALIRAIPLPQIADQAEELERSLRETSKNLVTVPDGSAADLEAEARAEELSQRARQLEDLLTGIPNMMQLQQEDRYWHALEEEYAGKRKLLTARAARIEEMMQGLDTEQARWEATSEQVGKVTGLEMVAARVQQELDAIHKVRAAANERLSRILNLQNRISEQDRELSQVLRKLDEAHQRLRDRLFERDSPPLWEARELRLPGQSVSEVIRLSASRGFSGTGNFLRTYKPLLTVSVAIYVFALLMAFRLRNYAAAEDKREVAPDGVQVFLRPFSAALLVTLLPIMEILVSAPTGVSFIICLLCLVPVLRLLPGLVLPGMRKILYALSAFYVFEWAHLVLQFGSAFKRELFALIIFLALIIFSRLTRPARLKIQPVRGWRSRLLFAANSAGLFLLAVSFIANVLGFVSLAQAFGVGVLFSAFTFAFLYTTVRVLYLSIVIGAGSAWFQSLPDVHAGLMERWALRLLVIFAGLLWLNINLHLFAARGTVMNALKSALQHPIGFGKSQVTLGGTLSLVLLLLLGYAIANIASFILGKILLPKLSLRGGMAYAISRVTYYILLGALFFAGLANAGLELDKFTVITGALGLGVGFGLQNIVNNFASGLIILFERPIRIGDTVEIGGISGIVRRIGARSSTVLTAQGAEVILPNSNLLSNQVTNWTLSSTRRLVEIPVRVSYGTDPGLVLKLLTEIAVSNPHVLTHPRPETLFLGFGESSLNIELRFWAAQSIWFELKSQISVTIFESFRQAGIEIPYPQRDLHVRSIDSLSKKELAPASSAQAFKQRLP